VSVLDYTNLCIVTRYWTTQTSVLSLGIGLHKPLYCHSVLDYTNLCIVTRYWITQISVLSLDIGLLKPLYCHSVLDYTNLCIVTVLDCALSNKVFEFEFETNTPHSRVQNWRSLSL
jgi:hypothetical protein